MSLSYRKSGPSIAIWISGVIVLAEALTMIMSPLDVGALVSLTPHPDHFVDLYSLFYFRYFHPEPLPPLPLYCPRACSRLSPASLPPPAPRRCATSSMSEK
jgi:hypothetical protein